MHSVLPYAVAPPADGLWTISPDQGRVTLDFLSFADNAGRQQQAPLTNCVVTYTRATQSLSHILDCPFQVSAGTYTALSLGFSSQVQVLVNDAAHGFYSDPSSSTGIATSPPTKGAQFVTVPRPVAAPHTTDWVFGYYLTSPLVVDSGARANVGIVVDMTHTLYVTVTAGIAAFDTLHGGFPVYLHASVSGVSGAEYYTSTQTAENTLSLERGVRVFYQSPSQPSFVISGTNDDSFPAGAWNANPATSPPIDGSGHRTGGYLGLDATGTLCWALPKDFTYSRYVEIVRMPVVRTLGGSTTLTLQHTSNVPPPISGNTYSSGCPSITPDGQIVEWLVAH
jgi:hypothetical protein